MPPMVQPTVCCSDQGTQQRLPARASRLTGCALRVRSPDAGAARRHTRIGARARCDPSSCILIRTNQAVQQLAICRATRSQPGAVQGVSNLCTGNKRRCCLQLAITHIDIPRLYRHLIDHTCNDLHRSETDPIKDAFVQLGTTIHPRIRIEYHSNPLSLTRWHHRPSAAERAAQRCKAAPHQRRAALARTTARRARRRAPGSHG